MYMSVCEDGINGGACRGGKALKAGYSCTHCPLWYVQTYNHGMVLDPF